ncbi:hypothetical protein [Myxosarcina sp. GI1(2024)]
MSQLKSGECDRNLSIGSILKDLLPKPSWVKISQVRTLSTKRLGSAIALLEEDFDNIV